MIGPNHFDSWRGALRASAVLAVLFCAGCAHHHECCADPDHVAQPPAPPVMPPPSSDYQNPCAPIPTDRGPPSAHGSDPTCNGGDDDEHHHHHHDHD